MAEALGTSESAILRLEKASKCVNAMQKHAGGSRIIITSQEDSYVFKVVKRNKNTSPIQMPADPAIATIKHISTKTISRPLVCNHHGRIIKWIYHIS